MPIMMPKTPNLPIFSIFRAVYIANQGSGTDSISFSGSFRGNLGGFTLKFGLIFISWYFLREQRCSRIHNLPKFGCFRHQHRTHLGSTILFRKSEVYSGQKNITDLMLEQGPTSHYLHTGLFWRGHKY